MPRPNPVQLDAKTIARCRKLVFDAAERFQIPPVLITAHVRHRTADIARTEVMRTMIVTIHLRRWQVARLFGRDVRRVRKSVLGV